MLTRETMTDKQRIEWPHLRNAYLFASLFELKAARENELCHAETATDASRKEYHTGRAALFARLIAEWVDDSY